MADQIHLHPRLEKQLAVMEDQTNAPFIAVGRARKIIDAMIKGQTSQAAGLFKARSDSRVKNCWKYDLGSGYRLLCIRTKKIIYVMHAGNHESCDTWLNNNAKRQPQDTEIKMTSFTIRDNPGLFDFQTILYMDREPDRESNFDEQYLIPIPQQYLRKVFCGLVAG